MSSRTSLAKPGADPGPLAYRRGGPLTVTGNATFASGSKIRIRLSDLNTAGGTYAVISAGSLTGASNLTADSALVPFLYKAALAVNGNTINVAINRKATGELVGGNLSVLYSIIGSASEADYKGKIIFIEDLDEYLYHIDRMMMNLKRNGCLESLKGIIVGSMTDMKDNDIPWGKNALEIVQDVTKQYNIPMVFNFPAGHIHDNRALILGATATIEVTENCSTVVFE